MTKQEVIDYIALWRYVAYLTGTPTEPFETPEKAKMIMEVLIMYEIKPTQTGKVLANNIIKSLAGQPPSFASVDFLLVNARWLNGGELCDALGLGRPTLYYVGFPFWIIVFPSTHGFGNHLKVGLLTLNHPVGTGGGAVCFLYGHLLYV